MGLSGAGALSKVATGPIEAVRVVAMTTGQPLLAVARQTFARGGVLGFFSGVEAGRVSSQPVYPVGEFKCNTAASPRGCRTFEKALSTCYQSTKLSVPCMPVPCSSLKTWEALRL